MSSQIYKIKSTQELEDIYRNVTKLYYDAIRWYVNYIAENRIDLKTIRLDQDYFGELFLAMRKGLNLDTTTYYEQTLIDMLHTVIMAVAAVDKIYVSLKDPYPGVISLDPSMFHNEDGTWVGHQFNCKYGLIESDTNRLLMVPNDASTVCLKRYRETHWVLVVSVKENV